MYLPYTASTDDVETTAEVNIRIVINSISTNSQSQWPHDLRRRSSAARLLRPWVRFPPVAWMCCLLWVLCVIRKRSLRRTDHSSTVVLPTVSRRCVWSRNFDNEEAISPLLGCRKYTRNGFITPGEKNGRTEVEVTRMTKKKSHKLHKFISFAKWQRNISKDDSQDMCFLQEKMWNTLSKILQEENICETKI